MSGPGAASAVVAGTSLPEVEVTATLRQLVRYAGASGDFYEMHYDPEFAAALGHPGLAVHGLLKAALLGRLVRDWLGPADRLVSFGVSYRGLDFRDRSMHLGGRVLDVDAGRARLELWIDRGDGARTTFGEAEVELGGRSGA